MGCTEKRIHGQRSPGVVTHVPSAVSCVVCGGAVYYAAEGVAHGARALCGQRCSSARRALRLRMTGGAGRRDVIYGGTGRETERSVSREVLARATSRTKKNIYIFHTNTCK